MALNNCVGYKKVIISPFLKHFVYYNETDLNFNEKQIVIYKEIFAIQAICIIIYQRNTYNYYTFITYSS